jgi:hypothetical protein
MLVISGSYSAQQLFARPICDLAPAIGSATPAPEPEDRNVLTYPDHQGIAGDKEDSFTSLITSRKVWVFRPRRTTFAVVFVSLDSPNLRQATLKCAAGYRCAKNVNNARKLDVISFQ